MPTIEGARQVEVASRSAGHAQGRIGLYALATIACINFVANFLLMNGFGLYEDDYLMTLPPMTWSWAEYLQNVRVVIVSPGQGRPLFWLLQYTLAYVLGAGKSLALLYLFSFAVTTLVGFLIYRVLRNLVSDWIALSVAVFAVAFPADTGKQIFMHQAAVQAAAGLALVAIGSFMAGRVWAFYLAGLAILLTYEPYFLLLFFVPLLPGPGNVRPFVRSMVAHAVLLAGLLLGVLLIRKVLGEARAGEVLGSLGVYLPRALQAPMFGGLTALALCVTRPMEAVLHSSLWQWVFVVLASTIAATVLVRVQSVRPIGVEGRDHVARGRIFVAGLGMFLSTYLYRFSGDYYPPVINLGRLSALHAVGLPGLCFMLASAMDYLVQRWRRSMPWVTGAIALYVGLLVSFGLEVQSSQYLRQWVLQKEFFQQILMQIPDLRASDVVLVNIETGYGAGMSDARPQTEGFPPFWMVNYPGRMLSYLLDLPPEWRTSPRLLGIWAEAEKELTVAGLAIRTPPFVSKEDRVVLRNQEFMLFEWRDGKLLRETKPIEYQGRAFFPRPLDTTEKHMSYQLSGLYRVLFVENLGARLWPTIIRSINYPGQ